MKTIKLKKKIDADIDYEIIDKFLIYYIPSNDEDFYLEELIFDWVLNVDKEFKGDFQEDDDTEELYYKYFK